MKKIKPTIFLFLFAYTLFFSSCKKNAVPARTFADVEADFNALDLSPGVHDVVLEMLNGDSYKFRVIAPVRNAGEKRPLVLALHGASGGNPDAYKNTACYIEPGLASLGAFILSPYGDDGLWYEAYYQQEVGTLLFLAKQYWPVDANKTVVTGYSNGGNGSWLFAETQPTSFAAAIPMATSYDITNSSGGGRKIDIPLYVIHGQNDELFPVAQTQTWVQLSQNAGSDITFVVAPGLGHYVPCSYVQYLQDAATWLENYVW
ncbi:MAG TPA: dienelactone hydrolase family protein [Chitinophagaceae bacterium]|nr:dienelactone hydrolase family protein [Chitinophagaceae bacterium]MCB9054234.1 dienelactone hydrolase family protein [Chitinophagales bacterium]HPG10314.1 dienelactone hydrolase family protein [Chitinophagaceae bacterium]HRX93194.1 dienelactone hydrolase family protein [Chitinophagaceae bacterium]